MTRPDHHHHHHHHYQMRASSDTESDDTVAREHYEVSDTKCEFPRLPRKASYRPFKLIALYLPWILIALFGVLQLAIFGIIIASVNTDNTGFEPDSATFALYKNSRFAHCSSVAPSPTNCTSILRGLEKDYKYEVWEQAGVTYIPRPTIYGLDGDSFEWCEIISCFQDFKVIPSRPLPSAIRFTDLTAWSNATIFALLALWGFNKRNRALYNESSVCKGRKELGIIDWIDIAYTIAGPFAWWWISFFQLVTDPVQSTSLSILACVAIWSKAMDLRFHPYSCALRKQPTIKRWAPRVLYTLALVQWVATIYPLLHLGWDDGSLYTSYECLQDRITAAPGISSCSAEELCSKSWMLSSLPFYFNLSTGGPALYILTFASATAAALSPTVITLVQTIRKKAFSNDEWSWREIKLHWHRWDIGPIAGPASAGILMTFAQRACRNGSSA
ncbi:hypothetical protein TruAng_011916 [Truncatella angustata]|nr:hypothetical protein TruAng_011916 [Truncatella angustata]